MRRAIFAIRATGHDYQLGPAACPRPLRGHPYEPLGAEFACSKFDCLEGGIWGEDTPRFAIDLWLRTEAVAEPLRPRLWRPATTGSATTTSEIRPCVRCSFLWSRAFARTHRTGKPRPASRPCVPGAWSRTADPPPVRDTSLAPQATTLHTFAAAQRRARSGALRALDGQPQSAEPAAGRCCGSGIALCVPCGDSHPWAR